MKTRERLRNIGKRLLASAMALSMCLSLVPDVSVSAADDSASYTVTLGDADGGQVEFYNSESGTTESVTDKQYAEGDTVEVKLTADDGYSIGGFVINDTDGAELYSDDTSDDVFEFTMPEMDIVVGGKFTKSDTESTEEAEDTQDNADYKTYTIEGTSIQIQGQQRSDDPVYYAAMKKYVDDFLSKDGTTSGVEFASTYKDGKAVLNWCPSTHLNGTNGGRAHCSDLVGYAWNSSTLSAKHKAASCEVSDVFNAIKKSSSYFKVVYQNSGSSNGKVYLQKGDILLFSTDGKGKVTFDESGNASGGTHIAFVYDIDSDGTIWIADCNGNMEGEGQGRTGVRNLGQVNDLTVDIEDSEDSEESGNDTNDLVIDMEASPLGKYISVLRYQAPIVHAFKITKTDGGSTIKYNTYTTKDGTTSVTKTGTVSCKRIASTNKGYGKLTDARFEVKTADGKAVTVYTDADCTKKAASTKLKAGTTYYIKGAKAGTKYTVSESVTPKGWQTAADKKFKLVDDKTASVTLVDTFSGDPVALKLKKKGATKDEPLAGVKFKLTDDSTINTNGAHRSWIFQTDEKGEINFSDPKFIVSGTAFMTDDKKYIRYYAGTYTLSEVAPPAGYLVKGNYLAMQNGSVISSDSFDKTSSSDNNILTFKVTVGTNGQAKAEINNVSLTNASVSISNTQRPYSFSISKKDATYDYDNKENHKIITDTISSNGTKTAGSTNCDHISATNAAGGYERLDTVRFTAKAGTKTIPVYSDEDCTKQVTGGLERGKKYYVAENDIKANGYKVTVSESIVPAGWNKSADKTVTLKSNANTAVNFSDKFSGAALNLTLTKTDKHSNKIEGALFTLTDNSTLGRKWIFKTDKDGKINFSDPSYLVRGTAFYTNADKTKLQFFGGTYTLTETKVPSDYMIKGDCTLKVGTETLKTKQAFEGSSAVLATIVIKPKTDGTGTASVSIDNIEVTNTARGVVNVRNEIKPHPFTIEKTDATDAAKYTIKTYADGKVTSTGSKSCDEIASGNKMYGRLSSAAFTITDESSNAKVVYDDADCTKKHSGNLKAGVTYYMKDTPAGSKFTVTETSPKGWSGTGDKQTLTLTVTGTPKVSFTDRFYGTELKLSLTKQNDVSGKLAGAVFRLRSSDGTNSSDYVYITDKNGIIDFSDTAYLRSGEVILDEAGKIQFFASNYTLTEISAPAGYKTSGWYITSSDDTKIKFSGKVCDFNITSGSDGHATAKIGSLILDNEKMTVVDAAKLMGFKINKTNVDTDDNTLEGGMTDYTTGFEVIYVGREGDNDDSYAWIDYNGNGEYDGASERVAKGANVKDPETGNNTWLTDKNGLYECAAILQTGTYEIVETVPPIGMLADSEYDRFDITFPDKWENINDKDIIDLTKTPLANSMIRGGVTGYKYDYDTLLKEAMAGSSFDGIEFWIKNVNDHDVWLDTNEDGVITDDDYKLTAGDEYKIATLENGNTEFSTSPAFLPYGDYVLYERQGSNDTYIIPDKYSKEGISFSIKNDLEYQMFVLDADEDELTGDLKTKYGPYMTSISSHFADGSKMDVKRNVTFTALGNDNVFANKVNRHGVAIIKYDSDEHADAAYSETLPTPQGDGKLIGAEYEVINMNNGAIMVDTDNDHKGDTKIEKNGVCTVLKTVLDDETGLEYAATNTTFLPAGTYKLVEKTPSVGYLNSTDRGGIVSHSYEVKDDGAYLLYGTSDKALTALKQIVTDKYPNTVFDGHTHEIKWIEKKTDVFAEPIMRGQVSIKKNDADRKEHKTGTNSMFKGDYDSKYAQGDASFANAVYNIYNISDSYVYTKGTNGNTTLERYESGKTAFAKLTGIDTESLEYTNGVCEQTFDAVFTDKTAESIRSGLAANICYTLTTDGNGNASTDKGALPYGTYLILEKTPSKGYRNTSSDGGCIAKIVRIREENETVDVNYDAKSTDRGLYESVIRGGFEVYKYDEETLMSVPQGTANLAGSFEVINRSESYVWVDSNEDGVLSDDEYYEPGAVVFTFKTDAKTGRYTSSNRLLPYGTYEIHETYPPYGYLHLSDINPNTSVFFNVREDGKIVSDGWFYDKDGNKVESFTHYAPVNAFDENGKRITEKELAGEKKEVTDARLIIYNYVMRGDLFFEKKSGIDKKKMAFIPFLMKSYDEDGNVIESHIIFTDQNGDFNTCADYVDHTYKTNAGDELYDYLMEYAKAYDDEDEDKIAELDAQYKDLTAGLAKGVGTWFGLNTKVSDNLNRQGNLDKALSQTGALPFGTYTIEELRCPNNKNYDMVSDTIIVDTDACETDAVTDPESFKEHKMHSTINFGTIYNTVKGLETVALTQKEQSHYSYAYSDLVIIDKVSYEGLVPGTKYKMVAELHDAVTGEILQDNWGKDVRVEKEFTAKLTTGSLDMNIEYDASDYKNGGSIVVFEYLYDLDSGLESPVMKEANIKEMDQQIHFPTIDSLLLPEGSEQHMIKADEDLSLVDTISYEGFEPDKTYVIEGVLMDGENVTEAADDDDESIKAEIYEETDELKYNKNGELIFKPKASEGTFKLSYKFNGKTLSGKTLVSYVEVKKNRETIAAHKDIADEDQTVYIPGIKTTALDKATGTHMIIADGIAEVIDTVKYSGLQPGFAYDVKGTLMDKNTNEPLLIDGKEITGSASFTAENTMGTVDVTFTFDASAIIGKSLVVYEDLYLNGEIIADHRDIDDEEQTIYTAKISTVAKDSESGLKLINPDGTVSITDIISYENFIPELTYVFKGRLVDIATGETLKDKDGNDVVSENEVTPKEKDGTTDVTFTFEGYTELEGKNVVVFEDAYLKKADGSLILVASEISLDNEDQTVYFPELHTTAFSNDTKINVAKAGKAEIVDTVAYYNVLPNIPYKVVGTLIDKDTAKAVTVDGKEVTAEAEFTPDNSYGTVDVTFKFDASDLSGKTLVAFEKLYVVKDKDVLVKSHEKIDDEKETIYLPKIGTTATDAKTGLHIANADEDITINDEIAYDNLVPGYEYTFVGQLINKSTKEPIKLTNGTSFDETALEHPMETEIAVSDKLNGKTKPGASENADTSDDAKNDANADNTGSSKSVESTAGGTYVIKKFTPTSANGKVEMTFVFDGREYAGATVAFESVYANGYLVAEHKDLNSDTQTVTVPKIKTNATNKKDGTHYASGEKTTIVDRVSYTGLIIGKEYEVKGTLMDKEANKPLLIDPKKGETAGNTVTASKKFTADKSDGYTDLEFTFDAKLLCGKTIVVFEDIYHEDKHVASHRDINDSDQSIHVVGISTTALDENTKQHVAINGKTVIVDTIEYDGLIPGCEYVLSGKLMDKKTQKAVTNGNNTSAIKSIVNKVTGKSNEYVSEIKFTPAAAKGSVTVKFEIDTTGLAGKSIVVYEKLYANGKQIAKHEDINSADQTVTVVSIKTKAYDKSTKGKSVAYGEKVTVTDTVTYTGLEPGKKYSLTGKLMDKGTKKAIKLISGDKNSKTDSNTVTITFVPKKADGTVDMNFVISTKDLSGKSLVAYEYLKLDNKVIAKHEDINSSDQTVTVPGVSTKATVDGKKKAKKSSNTVIVDTVSYNNLEKGKSYTLKGVLMDKKTGKSTGVTAEAKFTAKKSDGTAEVKFTIDTTKYDELVVFEELYYGKTLIGEHKDINDKAQTVSFSDTDTPPSRVPTGVSAMLIVLLAIMLIGGGAGIFFFKKKIR